MAGKELSSLLGLTKEHREGEDPGFGSRRIDFGGLDFSLLLALDVKENGLVRESLDAIEQTKEALMYSTRVRQGIRAAFKCSNIVSLNDSSFFLCS